MVESQFSKLIVAGSSPVLRSNGEMFEWFKKQHWKCCVL